MGWPRVSKEGRPAAAALSYCAERRRGGDQKSDRAHYATSGRVCRGLSERMVEDRTVRLFAYGTLQQREVQRATYGRLLDGTPDVLPGFRLEALTITDPEVVRLSGKAVHHIARKSGDPADHVPGVVYRLTEAELAATDGYEVDAYARAEVVLGSGARAFAYVGPGL